ncbi:hypothetical protein POVWA1_011030 [Plasmodium ovale wallikeri]|uniref:Uncharacterized protein n=1 Tax=Plasmodium ovale wallikeri TaxID=864142 RepID=A0A1A8YLH1_PLAOA|nr:hypothetical protein POVWA1_011030 [Plasmodium ovale wallikeri]
MTKSPDRKTFIYVFCRGRMHVHVQAFVHERVCIVYTFLYGRESMEVGGAPFKGTYIAHFSVASRMSPLLQSIKSHYPPSTPILYDPSAGDFCTPRYDMFY